MITDIKKLFNLSNKVALVTGGASGLGKGIAEGFAQYDAKVAVVDLNKEATEKTVKGINDMGGQAFGLTCDVSKVEDVWGVVAQVIDKFGKIDILLNSAGLAKRSKAEEMTDEMWNTVIDVNLKGAFFFCRAVGKKMIERGKGGRIINISSIAGVVGVKTGNVNYAASKGGLIAMTRCLAIEWAQHNILVNTIAPSHTRTPLIEKLIKEKPEIERHFLNNIPLGRLGNVVDIVGPAIFLASEAASFVSGHTLLVDGGHTAR
ncbi:MAG: glucose 1-dehydrogenase [Spirochaetales bacterium]|nr:glucose 1-dehydrogenase [Spirochaetales bacterium]